MKMQTYIWPILLPLMFLAYSLPLFLRVYATTHMVIDEEFHLRQGLHFCNKRFEIVSKNIFKVNKSQHIKNNYKFLVGPQNYYISRPVSVFFDIEPLGFLLGTGFKTNITSSCRN